MGGSFGKGFILYILSNFSCVKVFIVNNQNLKMQIRNETEKNREDLIKKMLNFHN